MTALLKLRHSYDHLTYNLSIWYLDTNHSEDQKKHTKYWEYTNCVSLGLQVCWLATAAGGGDGVLHPVLPEHGLPLPVQPGHVEDGEGRHGPRGAAGGGQCVLAAQVEALGAQGQQTRFSLPDFKYKIQFSEHFKSIFNASGIFS